MPLARLVRLCAAGCLVAAVAAVPALAGHGGGGGKVTIRYAALGDSFSSGVGTGSYTLSASCKRSVYAYPYLVAQQLRNTSLSFVACSGATTQDLIASQLQAVTSTTSLVTLTIGGNDIDFAGLIYQCTVADCSTALDTTRANLEATLGPKLDQVYDAVKSRAASGAKIVVLGYPRIFSGAGCLGTLGITSTEESKANDLADSLDQVIAEHAAADGVTYQSAISAFTGHAVCSSSPWLNGLNLANTDESYHPNRAGQSSGYVPLVRAITG
jgi:lysophospholipase L1-like esterase